MTWFQTIRSNYGAVSIGWALLGFLIAWPMFAAGQDKKDTLADPAVTSAPRCTLLPVWTGLAQEKPKGQDIIQRVPSLVPQKDDPKKKLSVMERKLKHAQQVLEGLALKDFDKVNKNAEGLMECLKEATWRINDTDKYLLYSNDFLRHIEDLQKSSKNKNIDKATIAYMEMTLTCVKCHEHLRETRIGAAPSISPFTLKHAMVSK